MLKQRYWKQRSNMCQLVLIYEVMTSERVYLSDSHLSVSYVSDDFMTIYHSAT